MLSIEFVPVFEGDFNGLADKVFGVGVVAGESSCDSIEEFKLTFKDVADVWFLGCGVHLGVALGRRCGGNSLFPPRFP